MAIQIIGDETIPHRGEEGSNGHTETDCSSAIESTFTSTCDDLAFEMYVDRDIARIIRLLEVRKHQAVQGESIIFIVSKFKI